MPFGEGEKMAPAWAQRQAELWSDCIVSPDVVVYLFTADNSTGPKIEYNAPITPPWKEALPGFHPFFTISSWSWDSCGCLLCCVGLGQAPGGLKRHGRLRPSRRDANAARGLN